MAPKFDGREQVEELIGDVVGILALGVAGLFAWALYLAVASALAGHLVPLA